MEIQPPSGGCVLKLTILAVGRPLLGPAAFGRLCVETSRWGSIGQSIQQPPSGGCVLKHNNPKNNAFARAAAFRRLCVETRQVQFGRNWIAQPPSGGCVLKRLRPQTRYTG